MILLLKLIAYLPQLTKLIELFIHIITVIKKEDDKKKITEAVEKIKTAETKEEKDAALDAWINSVNSK